MRFLSVLLVAAYVAMAQAETNDNTRVLRGLGKADPFPGQHPPPQEKWCDNGKGEDCHKLRELQQSHDDQSVARELGKADPFAGQHPPPQEEWCDQPGSKCPPRHV